MAIETLNYRFKVRAGTASALATLNEIPLRRELVFEMDTGKSKLGDGTTEYNLLPYTAGGALEAATEVTPTSGAFSLTQAAHGSRMLLHDGAGPITCPETVAAGFLVNDVVEVRWQSGAQPEFQAGGAATLDYNTTLFVPKIHHLKAVIALKVVAVNTWAIIGPLADP